MTQHTSNPNIPTPSQFGPYQGTPPPPQKNGIGLAALIVAIVGFLFACIPGALIIGWVLLPVAFILSIVGLTRSDRTSTRLNSSHVAISYAVFCLKKKRSTSAVS